MNEIRPHKMVETFHDGRRFYLAQYGPNWVVNLGSKATKPNDALARHLVEAAGGEPVHYVTDDDSVSGTLTAWWRTDGPVTE